MLRLNLLLISIISAVLSGCVSHESNSSEVPTVYKNSLNMEFVELPQGEFEMGSNEGIDTKPVHKVQLSSFMIMKYEVTNKQFEVFRYIKRSKLSPGDDMPVMSAKRQEVMEFIEWLSARDNVKYALPTEAQWEYAARGGLVGADYPWGDQWIDGKANIGGGDKRSKELATPVGSYEPNGFGLYDMCGNASEMVRERYYEYSSAVRINPLGPVEEPSDKPYLIRGIGIGEYFPQVWMRTMSFDDLNPFTEGFRLVIL